MKASEVLEGIFSRARIYGDVEVTVVPEFGIYDIPISEVSVRRNLEGKVVIIIRTRERF